MQRVTGIGGIFFKSENRARLYQWYEKHLGIKADPQQGTMFEWQQKDGKPAAPPGAFFHATVSTSIPATPASW